jgi:deoxycytidylate deaminase
VILHPQEPETVYEGRLEGLLREAEEGLKFWVGKEYHEKGLEHRQLSADLKQLMLYLIDDLYKREAPMTTEVIDRHVKMRLAQIAVLAQHSPCPRAKFGAAIYDPIRRTVLADGYNGAPRGGGKLCGGGHCLRDGTPRKTEPSYAGDLRNSKAVVLFINDEPVLREEGSTDSFIPSHPDGKLLRVFQNENSARRYESATRPDKIKSGTQVEVGCHHAEMNALCNASSQGAETQGKWLLVNGEPCLMCSKLLHHAGITKVICVKGGYSGANGIQYLLDHGVEVAYAEGPQDPRGEQK